MSMKKEIKKMLNSEKGGSYWINPYCRLNYRKTDYKDDPVMCPTLELEINFLTGFRIYNTTIKSRDYDGILAECQQLIERYFSELSDKLCSELRAGYNSKTAEFEPWQGF